MFAIDDYNPSMKKVGIRQEIFETMEALKVGESFLVPVATYAHVSVRARVSEHNKLNRAKGSARKYRAHFEDSGTRIIRTI